MKKRWRWLLIGLVAKLLLLVAFFYIGPGVIEGMMNKVVPGAGTLVGREAADIHRRLTIIDMHADSLLWDRDLNEPVSRGHVDLPRFVAGNVTLQIFSSVSKSPRNLNYDANGGDSDNLTALMMVQLAPPRTWGLLSGGNAPLERSLWQAERLEAMAGRSDGWLRMVTTPGDLDGVILARRHGLPVVGAMLSLEGLQGLDGQIANLDRLYKAGYRMASPAHFFDTPLAGSMHGLAKGGLTPFGRQVIRRMEALGMIVDVSHASHAAMRDILAMARRPVVASHGGVRATCKVNRNLTDDEIRGIARTGGVVGIGFWDAAICGTKTDDIVRAIAHVRAVAGIDHVGIGSDFDGTVTTPFDAGGLAQLTQALLTHGFTEAEIAKVMGGNSLRVLRAGLAPMRAGR